MEKEKDFYWRRIKCVKKLEYNEERDKYMGYDLGEFDKKEGDIFILDPGRANYYLENYPDSFHEIEMNRNDWLSLATEQFQKSKKVLDYLHENTDKTVIDLLYIDKRIEAMINEITEQEGNLIDLEDFKYNDFFEDNLETVVYYANMAINAVEGMRIDKERLETQKNISEKEPNFEINEYGEIIRPNNTKTPLQQKEEELSLLEEEEKKISQAEAVIKKEIDKKGKDIGE